MDWRPCVPLPVAPELRDDSVHVWCASLDQPPLSPAQLSGVLSASERADAEQYVAARDRVRSIASRGLLRWLLGSYLEMPPERVRLRLGPHGKPELVDQAQRLFFNVAHSEDVVLYAVARHQELGIDVERVRRMPDAAAVAARFFAPAEQAALLGVSAELRDEAFFVCWTRKEAFVKAHGAGLFLPLNSFEVGIERFEDAPVSVRVQVDPGQVARWWVHDLHPQARFIGALAVARREVGLACRRWV